MTKQTTLDDIAESISDLTTMVAGEFASVRQEMATKQEMATGFAEVHKNQRETNRRLEHLEATSETLVNDVRDMYVLIGDLRDDFKDATKDERRRLADLEAFAMQVAEKTGIPFIRKPKLRSSKP